MFWSPYAGAIPLGLVWPNGFATTSLGVAALAMAGQLALLALRAARLRAASVPHVSTPLDDEQEVKQAAA